MKFRGRFFLSVFYILRGIFWVQVLVVVIPCGFKSLHLHHTYLSQKQPFTNFVKRAVFWFTFFRVLVPLIIFKTFGGGFHLLESWVNINRRCADTGVTQHTAERFNISAALQNVGRVCVPKLVGRYVRDIRVFLLPFLEEFSVVGVIHRKGKRLSLFVMEYIPLAGFVCILHSG